MIRWREFIAGLGGAAWSMGLVRAQRAALPIIGNLGLAIIFTGTDTRPGGLEPAHSLD
jgi:hypothetical protein